MLSTPFRAQLWELGRTTSLGLLSRLAWMLAFTLLLYSSFYYLQSGDPQIIMARGVVLMSLLVSGVFSGAVSNELFLGCGSGFSFRLGFTRPISTTQLVVAPMLYTIVAALGCFLIPAAMFAFVAGTTFPIVGPSALLASMVTCFIASVWSSATVVGRWMGFVLTGSVLAIVLLMIDRRSEETLPYLLRAGALEYWEFPWYVYLGLALLAVAAIAFTVLAVDRQRHGDSIGLAIPFATAASRSVSRVSVVNRTSDVKPFRNQWTAQCWYDFQQTKKWLMFPAFLVPLAIVAFVGVANHFDPSPKETFYALASSLVLCPIMCPMIVIPAACAQHPMFDATRPMRSDHLVAMKWLMTAGWSLVGWLVMATATFLYLRFIYDWGAVTKAGESFFALAGEVSIYWWMVGAVSGLLLLINTASISMTCMFWIQLTLQPRVQFSVGVMAIIHIVLVAADILSVWSLRSLWITEGYLFAASIVALCVHVWKKSLGSGLLSKPYLVAALSMWAVFLCTTVPLLIRLSPAFPASTPMIAYIMGVTVLFLPLAAIAAAPLGLAAQRHR